MVHHKLPMVSLTISTNTTEITATIPNRPRGRPRIYPHCTEPECRRKKSFADVELLEAHRKEYHLPVVCGNCKQTLIGNLEMAKHAQDCPKKAQLPPKRDCYGRWVKVTTK